MIKSFLEQILKYIKIISGAMVTSSTLGRHTFPLVWTAETGITELFITTGWPVGTEVNLVGCFGANSASGGGAATYVIHASAVTGFTPGNYAVERYTSNAGGAPTPVADPIGDSIPNNPGMFKLISQRIFFRIVPNAGNITGSADVVLERISTI